jgi:Ser/Thr protein kinase RdoA (MazF antagonist)
VHDAKQAEPSARVWIARDEGREYDFGVSLELASHLAERYGIEPTRISELDAGVWRVERRDGPSWVARVFAPERPIESTEGDALILRALEAHGFPAERCAHPEPVSAYSSQAVLVTEFVDRGQPIRPGRTYAILGAMLGRLHARPARNLRAGGAWHHLSHTGGPREERAAASALLDEALERVSVRELALYDRLREQVEAADDCHDLPHAFVHPDFVPANAIPTDEGTFVIVDWTGAGRGPRLWSLGFLLWAAGARGPRLLDAVISRYRRHVRLEADELARLADAIHGRPLMLECWAFGNGRRGLAEVSDRVAQARDAAEQIAAYSRRALAAHRA